MSAERALGRLRHRVVDAPVRVRREAEELRALGRELEDLRMIFFVSCASPLLPRL
jgi:hypothetical protein